MHKVPHCNQFDMVIVGCKAMVRVPYILATAIWVFIAMKLLPSLWVVNPLMDTNDMRGLLEYIYFCGLYSFTFISYSFHCFTHTSSSFIATNSQWYKIVNINYCKSKHNSTALPFFFESLFMGQTIKDVFFQLREGTVERRERSRQCGEVNELRRWENNS